MLYFLLATLQDLFKQNSIQVATPVPTDSPGHGEDQAECQRGQGRSGQQLWWLFSLKSFRVINIINSWRIIS